MVKNPLLRPPTRLLEKYVYSHADYILALTPKMKEYVCKLGANPDKVGLMLIPVDTNKFKPAPQSKSLLKKWGLNEKDKVILFIGTLFDFSGLDFLIQHFPEILECCPETKLLIVGDGVQRKILEKLIAENYLKDKVIITGFQPYDEMPRYINLAIICISPFLNNKITRDIFPSKIVQYLACGKSVVSSRLQGLQEVIAGEKQGVVYYNDIPDMITQLLVLLKSTKQRNTIGKAGLIYAQQKHDIIKIARQLENRFSKEVTD